MVRLPVIPPGFVPNRKGRRAQKAMLEKTLAESLAQRQCGECKACCHILAIPEIEKPFDTMCRHAGPGPRCCTIYDSRPKPCKEYQCLWKLGAGTLEQRPDQLGLVISPTRPGTPGYPGASVHELWPGAIDANMSGFLHEMAQRHPLLLIREGRLSRVMGPEHVILGMKSEIERLRQMYLAEKAGL